MQLSGVSIFGKICEKKNFKNLILIVVLVLESLSLMFYKSRWVNNRNRKQRHKFVGWLSVDYITLKVAKRAIFCTKPSPC